VTFNQLITTTPKKAMETFKEMVEYIPQYKVDHLAELVQLYYDQKYAETISILPSFEEFFNSTLYGHLIFHQLVHELKKAILATAVAVYGRIKIERIAEILGISEDETVTLLRQAILERLIYGRYDGVEKVFLGQTHLDDVIVTEDILIEARVLREKIGLALWQKSQVDEV